MATIATVYISAGLPAQDSAGTLPAASAHVIATAYITAGLPANDYVAAAATWRKIQDDNAGMDIFGDRVGGVF